MEIVKIGKETYQLQIAVICQIFLPPMFFTVWIQTWSQQWNASYCLCFIARIIIMYIL